MIFTAPAIYDFFHASYKIKQTELKLSCRNQYYKSENQLCVGESIDATVCEAENDEPIVKPHSTLCSPSQVRVWCEMQ